MQLYFLTEDKNSLESGILPKLIQGKGLTSILDKQLKIFTPKQMLQRLPIALAQIKARNASEDLLSEIRQIILFLYLAEEIPKKSIQQ